MFSLTEMKESPREQSCKRYKGGLFKRGEVWAVFAFKYRKSIALELLSSVEFDKKYRLIVNIFCDEQSVKETFFWILRDNSRK